MPGELGTFLALTGTPFTGSEAKEVLGLADEILTWNKDVQELISGRLLVADKTITAAELHYSDGIVDNVFRHKNEATLRGAREKIQFLDEHDSLHSHLGLKKSQIEGALEQKAAASVDMQYKQLLRKDLEHKVLHDSTKLGSGTTGHYLNHYAHTLDYIKNWIPFEQADCTNSICRSHENEINRCFYPDSLDQIIENLKKENSNFAKYCLRKFEESDKVSLNITLALLRKAVKGSYSECCHFELTAMLNLLKNEHNVTENTPMSKELIEEFFKTPEEYKYVDLEVKKHAPLPTRKYYQKYADHMRLLMNEHNSYHWSIRNGYDREVQSELREVGIDIRDSGLTPQIIRTSLWNKEQAQRAKQHAKQLEGYFVNDDKFSEKYYADVAGYIEKLSGTDERWSETHEDYYTLVNDMVKK